MSQDFVVFMKLLLVLIGLMFIYRFYLVIRSVRYERRIARYTIENLKPNSMSFFDRLERNYRKLCHRLGNRLNKTKIGKEYSQKYVNYIGGFYKQETDFLANKILLGLIFLLVVFIVLVIQSQLIGWYLSLLSFLIGFFIPDVIFIITKKVTEKEIRDDFMKAITIMNNAFKAGNSIMQAIRVVSEEIEGPLAKEFQNMYMDINFGLDLETTFNRFYERVPLEEVKYITSSLIVLNQTGGNIVQIFSTIEKNFYARQKLKNELKATTSSANAIFKILILLPIFMIALITFLNPSYFLVLITTGIGIMISTLIVLLYIGYILIVRQVMKIEEYK